MVSGILATLSHFIINTISHLGYGGIVLLMAIESANIPLPSEVIMPFSGFLVSVGRFSLFWVGISGAVGCVLGSVLSYWIGAVGGRPLILKYGKYVLISHRDLNHTDRWYEKHGAITVFIGRLLPVVRTFISLSAGIARVNLWTFSIYTFVGSFIWSYALGWVGFKLGENWESLRGYFHNADIFILILVVVGLSLWIWRHLRAPKD